MFIKYNGDIDLNLNDYVGGVVDHLFADIMYVKEDPDSNEVYEYLEDEDLEGTKIGITSRINYNQALAKAYNIDMTQLPYLTLRVISNSLFELDYTRITQPGDMACIKNQKNTLFSIWKMPHLW